MELVFNFPYWVDENGRKFHIRAWKKKDVLFYGLIFEAMALTIEEEGSLFR